MSEDVRVTDRKVSYFVKYKYPSCFDDDDPSGGPHDQSWKETWDEVKASTEAEAQAASLDPRFNWVDRCCSNRRAHPVTIMKVVIETGEGGWKRRTESNVPLPTSQNV